MSISKETIEDIARLARLTLAQEKKDTFLKQLQGILDFIDALTHVDIEHVEPTTHSVASSNVFRADAPQDSLPVEKTLGNAPACDGHFFVVPKIIE